MRWELENHVYPCMWESTSCSAFSSAVLLCCLSFQSIYLRMILLGLAALAIFSFDDWTPLLVYPLPLLHIIFIHTDNCEHFEVWNFSHFQLIWYSKCVINIASKCQPIQAFCQNILKMNKKIFLNMSITWKEHFMSILRFADTDLLQIVTQENAPGPQTEKWQTFQHTKELQNYMYNGSNIHDSLWEIPTPNKYNIQT